jgi:hypothetical protein
VSPKVDVSKLAPVLEAWEAGPLRVYLNPHTSSKLKPARPYAPYGVGYAVPLEGTWPLPNGVHLHLKLIDGVLRIVGIEVGERPPDFDEKLYEEKGIKQVTRLEWLTGAYLRGLPVDKYSRRLARELAVRLYRRPRGEVIGVDAYEAGLQEATNEFDFSGVVAAQKQLDEHSQQVLNRHTKRRRGRPPIPAETLQQAAEIARKAEADGVSPNGRICLEMQVQPSTAKKYLAKARKDGLLPPTSQRGREKDG